jgi:hypothetical protein
MAHKVYLAIGKAERTGKLTEPFSKDDSIVVCTGLGHGTELYKPRYALEQCVPAESSASRIVKQAAQQRMSS